MEIRTKAYAYLLASLAIGALTPVLLGAAKDANLYEFFFLAYLITAPAGLLLLIGKRKAHGVSTLLRNRKRLFYLILAVILFFTPYLYGLAYAERFIPASLATVLFRVNPVLMLIFIALILRERLSRYQLAALCLAFAGIVIGVSGGNPLALIGGGANLPIMAFVIMLALSYALANVIIKRHLFDTDIFIALSGVVMLAFAAILFIAAGMPLSPLSQSDLVIIVYIAVTNIVSFYMYFNAVRMLKMTVVTNAFFLSPFLTFIYAAAILGEPIATYYIIIAALTTAGILIQRYDKKGGSYASSRSKPHMRRFTLFDVTGVFGNSDGSEIGAIVSEGGRVVATKIDQDHMQHVEALSGDYGYKNVYAEGHGAIIKETGFIRHMTGAGEGDTIVVKAGPSEENEAFFDELGGRIAGSPAEKTAGPLHDA